MNAAAGAQNFLNSAVGRCCWRRCAQSSGAAPERSAAGRRTQRRPRHHQQAQPGTAVARVGAAPEDPLLADALAASRRITDAYDQVKALAALAPHLSEPERMKALADALTAAREIVSEEARAEVLAGLAPQLSEPLQAEALAAAATSPTRTPGPRR